MPKHNAKQNPLPSGMGRVKDWMLTDEQMDKAYILGSYGGDKFGHSAIAKAQAHKIVGAILAKSRDFSSAAMSGEPYVALWIPKVWWEQLCKDVGL